MNERSWLRRRVIQSGVTLPMASPDCVSRSHNPSLSVKRGPAFLIAVEANLAAVGQVKCAHGRSCNPDCFPGSRKNGSWREVCQ